ncbi:MAG: beta-ketoacyl-ACP synthase II [Gammaproteobacteria bacterium]
MSKRRVVVTGLGAISPLGNSVAETWKNVLQGRSGVTAVEGFEYSNEDFDPETFPVHIWAKVHKFDNSGFVTHKMDPVIQFSLAASIEAMRDAGLEVNDANAPRIGVAVGSGIGGLQTICNNYVHLKKGPRKVKPNFIPAGIINSIAGYISIDHHLKGPNISIVTACTTGTHNIGTAARMIGYGDADVMLAGGSELASTPLCLAGFAAARALSKRNDEPQRASRPWDKDRDGFVLGEGAGILVLEEYEHAKKRGAKIYAELVGFGMSADAFHITAPDKGEGSGAVRAMTNALQDAQMNPEEITYVNAHGTSTRINDINETNAIKRAFDDHAYKLAISSTKSMTGHLLGASGAVEAIFSVLSIRDQVAPGTINLDEPDEGCDLNYLPHESQQMPIDTVLSNSFGFGGTNGSLIFRKI